MTETQEQKDKDPSQTVVPRAGGVRLSDLARKRAENLRNNLQRRKEQSRARSENHSDNQDDKSRDR